ncbi:leucine-rich repeat-containing protein 15-like [Branchiostoma lanceolatum]|uniref:leucine-rich repeat-containing protein 15-like n=1 Tax=Branchiostoma lanceolatum TaxID=7740 RepID=UPI0034547851
MGRKLQDLLIFLLIILKEFHMTEASCSCSSSSSSCSCNFLSLTSIPQDLNTSITNLDLGYNQITTLSQSDFSRYTNLISLHLTNNDISSIEAGTFSHTPQLQRLELYGNNLTSIPQGVFGGLNQLQHLYLYSNHMKTIPPNTFTNLQQLLYLYLHDNDISSIPTAAFANLPRLQRLNLYTNQITHIQSGTFSNLPQLQRLYLDSNKITHVESGAFSNLPQLLQLQLQNNQLTSIPTIQYQFPELQNLYLSYNNITDIPADAFFNQPKLSSLLLHSNRISTVSSAAFTGLANLKTLYLYNNALTVLPDYLFVGLSGLDSLQLQHNAIMQIFPDTFTEITTLTYLYLSNNNIKTFPIEALSKIPSIYRLYLHSNQMMTLPLEAYDMLSSISVVDIGINPWQCDCRIVGFRQKMTGTPSFEYQITCTDPRHDGQRLKDINPEDLTCEEPMIVSFEKGDDNSVVEGETLHLVCEASGIPTPDITVTLPSGLNITAELNEGVSMTVNVTVTITDVTVADAGLYICIAASPVGSAFKTLSVDIQPNVPPAVTMTTVPSSPNNFTLPGTSDKPEPQGSAPSFSLPVLLGAVFGAAAGIILIGGIIFTIWYKRRTQNPHDQTGQGESQNDPNPGYPQRLAVPQLSLDVEPPMIRPRSTGTGAAAAVYVNEPAVALDNPNYMYTTNV